MNKDRYSFEEIFSVFNALYPLSDELKSAIRNDAEIIEVKKKTKLLQAGEVANSIYFIIKGAARVFYLDKDGHETTTWFLLENELLISVYSFYTGNPSFEYLETLEDCTIISLKREKLNKLYLDFLEFNFIGRRLTEIYHTRNEEQTNNLRMLSAKERYQNLMNTNPKLINRVALGHIASYLGISQETLSRIRKQIF
ncbi:MAG: Crp/Fnr family transcriptional regulator [Pedobacter sp.]|nr:MAG: Crp/Fnr family transcriptional regulator [Pedobacter sp.]